MRCSKVLWKWAETNSPTNSQQLSHLQLDLKSCFKIGKINCILENEVADYQCAGRWKETTCCAICIFLTAELMLKHSTMYVWANQITNNCSICSRWMILCGAGGHKDNCWEIWKIWKFWSNIYKEAGKGQKAPVKKQKLWILPQRKPGWGVATVHHNNPSVQPHRPMLKTCMMVKWSNVFV